MIFRDVYLFIKRIKYIVISKSIDVIKNNLYISLYFIVLE